MKQNHVCVFIGELSKDTSDSLTFPLSHSFHYISSQGCRVAFPSEATEHWGVSLRGPMGLNAWHVSVHINLNKGTKWQACDSDGPLKLKVTCYSSEASDQEGSASSSGALGRLLGRGCRTDRWLIRRAMLTLSISRQGLESCFVMLKISHGGSYSYLQHLCIIISSVSIYVAHTCIDSDHTADWLINVDNGRWWRLDWSRIGQFGRREGRKEGRKEEGKKGGREEGSEGGRKGKRERNKNRKKKKEGKEVEGRKEEGREGGRKRVRREGGKEERKEGKTQ